MFEQIGKTMIEVSLLSVAAILLVMILRAVFGAKLKTRLLGVLWMVVLLRLVLPVTFDSPVHIGDIFSFNAPPIERTAVQDSDVASQHVFNVNDSAAFDMDLADKPNTETTNVSVDNAVQKPIEVNPWHVVLAVWLIGTVGFLVVNVYRMFAFKRKVHFGKTLNTPVIQRLVSSNKTKLGLSKNIRVAECRYISVPVVMGLKQPMILLPEGLVDTIVECKLDKIILHEMCHIKRKDLLKSILWLAARAIHWFNPLIWFAYKAYLDDIERACDETAMRYLSRDGIYEYSEALVEVVKCAKLNCNAPVLVSFCKDKSKLRKRVMNMIKPQRKSKSVSIIAVLLMLTIVLGCFTTACTSAEPQEASAKIAGDAVVQLDETSDEEADLWTAIDGKEELLYIGRADKIDIEQSVTEGTALPLEKARELALNYLKEKAHITHMENLKTVAVSRFLDDTTLYPRYIFEFEYRSDQPTFSEFDYNATIKIESGMRNPTRWQIMPILNNLDIIPAEKAEQLAKEYTLSTYKYLKAKDLYLFKKQIRLFSGKIYYWFDFERPSECITVLVSAETGDCELFSK